jgi:hypothetical protein
MLRSTYGVQNEWAPEPKQPEAAVEKARDPRALENFNSRKANVLLSNYQVGNAWIDTPDMVENVERDFGPGQPTLAYPNQSSVQIASAPAETRAKRPPPVQSLLANAEERLKEAEMELEQRERMIRSGKVRPEERTKISLIAPNFECRVMEPGIEGSFGFLAPLFPDAKWDSDYRAHMQMHKKATQQRLESVPPRARPNFTRRAVEPTAVMQEPLLMNGRVLHYPAHNPNYRSHAF